MIELDNTTPLADDEDFLNSGPLSTTYFFNTANALPIEDNIMEMIILAYNDELREIDYLNRIMQITYNPMDKDIIWQIKLDTQKHAKLLEQILQKISGENNNNSFEQKVVDKNPVRNYEKSMFYKLETAEYYRKIYYYIIDIEIQHIIFEIISDKQAHAIKFSYLFSKNYR